MLLIIAGASFFASGLTLFSGFGLGTLLLPAFAFFFPVQTAVGLTAMVHFLNNLFKLVLLGRQADRAVVLRFGLPAVLAAFLGARSLTALSGLGMLLSYEAFGREFQILPAKLAIGLVLILFAVLESIPALGEISLERRHLPLGGVLSGFFGGLSGHQGALRSAFLIRLGLSKESFIASGVVIACMVDATRLGVYFSKLDAATLRANALPLAAAVFSAFAGAWGGNRLLGKTTIEAVRRIVTGMLFFIGAGLAAGVF